MPKPMDTPAVLEFVVFAATGAVSATQDVVRRVRQSVDEADAELVAEETLALVATATARAAEVGLREAPPASREAACEALLELPFTYRDYLIGRAMIAQGDPSLTSEAGAARERLARKRQFYTTHLPAGRFPGEHALTDKMALWMGRVSPPKLPEMPQERLEKLELVDHVLAHLKVVLAAARRRANSDGEENRRQENEPGRAGTQA